MTPLETIIRSQIAQTGPISLHDYMALCLGHPEHGYYITKDPFGAAGDFTTAPEISQMFGELIGLALVQTWIEQGQPAPFILAELGPGRGQLMQDILRVAARAPGFNEAAQVWLVETSPTLRAEQAKRIDPSPNWAQSIADIPEGPLFLIANEFFDALPIHQYVMKSGHWHERMIGLENDAPAFGLRNTGMTSPAAPDGSIWERCRQGAAICRSISERIAAQGVAIIIDYGYGETPEMGGDTFQAIREHAFADPLMFPGKADLTAHVDFAALAKAAEEAGARPSKLITQGDLLHRLGIGARAAALAKARPDKAEETEAALKRLTHHEKMGTLFKALALYPPGASPPPGFDP
ncbi:MAG: SAM-dependent methyltransferase [Pseudomonadota bacterium]